jgi:hypothetical protein
MSEYSQLMTRDPDTGDSRLDEASGQETIGRDSGMGYGGAPLVGPVTDPWSGEESVHNFGGGFGRVS